MGTEGEGGGGYKPVKHACTKEILKDMLFPIADIDRALEVCGHDPTKCIDFCLKGGDKGAPDSAKTDTDKSLTVDCAEIAQFEAAEAFVK